MYRLCFLLILIITLKPLICYSEERFFIADDEAWPPYISVDDEGNPKGIFYDIITTAFSRMNTPLRYELFSWNRAQAMVKDGKAHALVTTATPQRLEFLQASKNPILLTKYKIFTQNDNPELHRIRNIQSLDDLHGLSIIDYLGDGWAKANLSQYDIYWAPDIMSVCKRLAAGHGDIFIQDEIGTLFTILHIKQKFPATYQRLNFNNIIAFDAPVKPVAFHLLIRRDSEFLDLLPQFDIIFEEMEKEGLIDSIKEKWLL